VDFLPDSPIYDNSARVEAHDRCGLMASGGIIGTQHAGATMCEGKRENRDGVRRNHQTTILKEDCDV